MTLGGGSRGYRNGRSVTNSWVLTGQEEELGGRRLGRIWGMRIRVAVCDPLPVYRRGVMAILSDARLQVDGPEEPEDVIAWSTGKQQRAALMTVDSTSGQGWNAIARLRELESQPIVLALLADSTVDSYIRAMVTGASSAVARNAAPELICQVFLETLRGRSLLPMGVSNRTEALLKANRNGWL